MRFVLCSFCRLLHDCIGRLIAPNSVTHSTASYSTHKLVRMSVCYSHKINVLQRGLLQCHSQSPMVWFTPDLLFDRHANNIARACNYHTRALRHVRSLLTDEVAQTVVCSIVASRLDYCNTLLHGSPAATIVKLQRAQNNLARVVCQRAVVAQMQRRCRGRCTGCR